MCQIANHRVFSEVTLVGKENLYYLHGTVIEVLILAANVFEKLQCLIVFSSCTN